MNIKLSGVSMLIVATLAVASLLPRAATAQGPPPIVWMQGGDGEATSFSPDGTKLAVGENGYLTGALVLWDLATEQVIESFPTSAVGVNSVAYAPNGESIAVGGSGASAGVIEVWSVSTGSLLKSFKTSAASVKSVAYSPNGATLAAGGITGTKGVVELWNVSSGSHIALSITASAVDSVAFSSDGTMLAVGGTNGSAGLLEVWKVTTATATLQKSFSTHAAAGVLSAAFCSTNTKLAAGGSYLDSKSASHGVLELWTVATETLIKTLPTSASVVNSVACTTTSVAAGGARLLNSSGDTAGTLELFSLSSPYALKTLPTHQYAVTSVSVFDNDTLANGGQGAMELWNLGTDKLTANLGTGAAFAFAALSPDGKTIVVAGSNGSDTAGDGASTNTGVEHSVLQLWNSDTGTLRQSFPSSASLLQLMAFSPDGTILATGGTQIPGTAGQQYSGVLEVVNMITGKVTMLNTSQAWVDGIAISPDGKTLADGGSDFTTPIIELWDMSVSPPKLSKTFDSNQFCRSVAFSPDGSLLAAGCKHGVIELWNIAAGQIQASLVTSINSSGPGVSWSMDGKTIAAAGQSQDSNGVYHGAIEIWNVATKTRMHLFNNGISAFAGAFSPDGTTLVIGTDLAIDFYSTANWSLIKTYSEELGGGVVSLAFPASASTPYVIGRQDGTIMLADNPYAIAVKSIVLDPANVISGGMVKGTITLSAATPIGATVSLGPAGLGLPASVAIPAGKTSAMFTFTAATVTASKTVTVTAAYNGTSASTTLTVKPK